MVQGVKDNIEISNKYNEALELLNNIVIDSHVKFSDTVFIKLHVDHSFL